MNATYVFKLIIVTTSYNYKNGLLEKKSNNVLPFFS